MERFALSEDEAFSYLRRLSSDHEVRVRALAEEIVRTRVVPARPVDRPRLRREGSASPA